MRYCKLIDVDIVPQEEHSNVDQFPNQDWNYTEFGTLRNDISALMAAKTDAEYNMIASRLSEIQSDDQFKGLSDDEILKRISPRLFQDPVEIERFAEYLGHLDLQRDNSKNVVNDFVEPKPSDGVDGNTSQVPDGL